MERWNGLADEDEEEGMMAAVWKFCGDDEVCGSE